MKKKVLNKFRVSIILFVISLILSVGGFLLIDSNILQMILLLIEFLCLINMLYKSIEYKKVKRFEKYSEYINDKENVNLKKMANHFNESLENIEKDLSEMIDDQWMNGKIEKHRLYVSEESE